MPRPVLFLSDYGSTDEFAGVCRAVIATIAPEVRVIDLTHGIPRQDVMRGALALAAAVLHAPEDAVFLAVVDPGVGTERRPLVVEANGRLFVGPDNGLLSLGWARLGERGRAFHIRGRSVSWTPMSQSFDGRDVFAPAAARLAAGAALEEIGDPITGEAPVELAIPRPDIARGRLECEVLSVDTYGNVQLALDPHQLEAAGLATASALAVQIGGRTRVLPVVGTFGHLPDGTDGVMVDSSGYLAIVRNLGSAAEGLELTAGARVVLSDAVE